MVTLCNAERDRRFEVVRNREKSLTPKSKAKQAGWDRRGHHQLSLSNVLAPLEIPKPVDSRVLLTPDKLLEPAQIIFAGTILKVIRLLFLNIFVASRGSLVWSNRPTAAKTSTIKLSCEKSTYVVRSSGRVMTGEGSTELLVCRSVYRGVHETADEFVGASDTLNDP